MFDNNIRVEPIPERVFELCSLVSKKPNLESEFRNMMEPTTLNNSTTPYFTYIRDVAIELNLIEKNEKNLIFVGDKAVVKNLTSFRKYCNSIVWLNKDTYFYKIARCFLDSDDRWLQYGTLTDFKITTEVRESTGISNVQNVYMLGTRFWLSFLGFGYIQEGRTMNFLPNMYTALKDFIMLSDLEKGKEYSISDFVNIISEISDVAFGRYEEKQMFNLAFSNALRQLHNTKEITLKRNYDSKEVWNLYPNPSHQFTSEVTHIVYKGVKS